MPASIVHDPNQFNVAGSTWTIIKHATQEVVWTRPGGSTGLVVDNDGYLMAFEGMFPLMVPAWGPGPYRLSAVIGGQALGRIANMRSFWEAPDLETAMAAKKEIRSGLTEPSFVTRTTRKSTDHLRMRTHTGTLQMDSGERVPVGPDAAGQAIVAAAELQSNRKPMPGLLGYGNVIGEDGATHVGIPIVAGTATTIVRNPGAESPSMMEGRKEFLSGMSVLAGALRGTLIKRQLTWGARLAKTAEIFADQGLYKESLATPRPPLRARFHVGSRVVTDQVDTQILYHLAGGNVAHKAYLDWLSAYQEVEFHLLTHNERTEDATEFPTDALDPSSIGSLLTQMVNDACTIYLAETGQSNGLSTDELPSDPDLHFTVISACCRFIAEKDADYGQAIRRFGMKGLLIRLFDKYSRYTTLASRADRAGKFESLEDTAKDLLCYSLMAKAFWCEQQDDEVPDLGA